MNLIKINLIYLIKRNILIIFYIINTRINNYTFINIKLI
jgi:hypothetical protein